MSEETLDNCICALANKLMPGEETSQLKFILVDHIHNVKESQSALDIFRVLKESQTITVENVHIIYEILSLMNKKKLWTEFRKDMLSDITIPDHDYEVENSSRSFSKFRLMMIKIGNNLTSGMVTCLKTVYKVRKDFSIEWLFLHHLEQNLNVNQDDQKTIETFGKNLRLANCPKGATVVEQYVMQIKSAIKECGFKQPNTRKDSKGSKTKCAILKQVHDVINKADRLLEQVESAKTRVEDTSRQSKKDFNDLKKKINEYLEECENEIDDRKASKIEELENTSEAINHSLEDARQLKEDIEKTEERFEVLKSDVREVDKTLNGFLPNCVGYFKSSSKNVFHIFNKLHYIMEEQKPLYVDYCPVDVKHCTLNTDKLVKRCFDVGEQFQLNVDLRDSYGRVSVEEQEEAYVTVCIADFINSDDFKINEHKVEDNVHKIKCKFTSPGEWTVEVKVFGKLILKPFKLKVSPGSLASKVIKCGQNESVKAAILDVTFTSDGQKILACNSTNQVLLFDLSGNMKTYCELEKDRKLLSLCCISNGTVFVTDTEYKEIVTLEKEGTLKGSFGKSHFETVQTEHGPEGIAAIIKDNHTHVFTSNLKDNRLDYFIDGTFFDSISVGDKKLNSWFIALNSKFQLLISNNGYLLDIIDIKQGQIDKQVPSMYCHSSVCVDENDNIFLGSQSEIQMYKSDFNFVRRFKCENAIIGIAARFGHLAVVLPCEIRLFQY